MNNESGQSLEIYSKLSIGEAQKEYDEVTRLKAARVRGRMGGRPPVLDNRQINRMIEMYDEQKNTVAEICKIYDISRPSFYNYLKKRKQIIVE